MFTAQLPSTATSAVDIARSAVDAVHAGRLTTRALDEPSIIRLLDTARRVHLIAIGKAAAEMHSAVRARLGPPTGLDLVVTTPNTVSTKDTAAGRWMFGDHPVPGPRSLAAGVALHEALTATRFAAGDVVVFAVSGGASALIALPRPPLTLDDLASLHRELVLSGLDVTDVNHVRAAVSAVHGGALLRLIGAAIPVGLILCDNVQVGMRAVASGLTVPDFVDPATAHEVADSVQLPVALRDSVKSIIGGWHPPARQDVHNVVIGSPADALHAATQRARQLGYEPVSLGDRVQGEARDLAARLGGLARDAGKKLCVLATGEVSVSVRGIGAGGRCQELAYAMSRELRGLTGAGFAAVATDGRDFLDDVMGAWVSGETYDRMGMTDAEWSAVLDRNDTNGPLRSLGQCLAGQRTGTNVCDVYVLCVDPGDG